MQTVQQAGRGANGNGAFRFGKQRNGMARTGELWQFIC